MTTKTPEQVRAEFLREGMTLSGWASANGFDKATVNQVLRGHNKATRGVGHRIAVMLGIKDGVIVDDKEVQS
jgi:gp16 family phage-associated protein